LNTANSIFLLIGLGLFCLIIFSFFSFLFSLVSDSLTSIRDKWRVKYSAAFDKELKEKYSDYFHRHDYYNRLNDEQRVKFLYRVRKFMKGKSFVSRDELTVTEEMKARIAGAAVQLTFGLDKYVLDRFSRIFIYSDSYYSSVTGKYHMGEANPLGVLVISWQDFIEGFDNPTDTFNVGLHEMAHALELSQSLGDDYDLYFASYYDKWRHIARPEYETLEEGGASFLREYAGTNTHEFFAVCVESFFEKPNEFREKLPEIYHHLCILLNQDPLAPGMKLATAPWNSARDYDEALSSIEAFSTKYSSEAILSPVLQGLLFAGMFLLQAGAFLNSIALFGLMPLVNTSFRLNSAVMYENYLGVKGVFGTLKTAFRLEDIVSVQIKQEKYCQRMHVLIVDNGSMLRFTYILTANSDDIDTLKQMLVKRNVVVKYQSAAA
jgi:Mlc titration factor MtfA (ptsG expression regulator)